MYRYMHYHNRYKAHTDSFKQESRLKETIRDKVSSLEARDSKLKDFSWVTNGLNRLFRSRRALSYSYPFAFYMFGDDLFKDEMTNEQREIKQNLFEDQQQQLEANVEKLSKFIEEPFDEYNDEQIMEVRMQIINLSVLTDTLCKKMYDCIENELLASLLFCNHNIAPYQSKGIERATELTYGRGTNATNKNECPTVVDQTNGSSIDDERPQCSASSDENGCTSRKRARKEKSLFDLNLPADLIDRQ
nr:probable E3 ubiquitin-protein ligase ARI2 isoform X1 [Ipomoea batatas]